MSTGKPTYGILNLFIVLSLYLIASPCNAQAQSKQLNLDLYTQENGLSNNIVHCIYQDSKGFMWFGTTQGLSRFDGYVFTSYRNIPKDSSSLEGELVRTIFEDKAGNLWIGTENGGLQSFNRKKEKFDRFDFQHSHPFSGKSVNTIVEDRDQNLWIGTDAGLYKYNPQKKSLENFRYNPNQSSSIADNYVRMLLNDSNNNLWIGTNRGLDLLDGKTKQLHHIIQDQVQIWKLFEDNAGNIWIGTYSEGLYLYNLKSEKLTQYVIDPKNERSTTVRAIAQDLSGDYWIGTRGGLYQYSLKTGIKAFYEHEELNAYSLSHNSILDIFRDKKGDLWIGTRFGINYLANEKQYFKSYKANPQNRQSLNDNEIYTFWEAPDKKLWIGTERGGINIVDPEKGTYSFLTHSSNSATSISNDCVKAITNDPYGNVLIGTFMGGMDIYNPKTQTFRHFKNDPANSTSISDNIVWALLRDAENEIWVGTNQGLDRFDPGTNSFVHYSHLIGKQPINWISTDSENNLWLGSANELIIFDKYRNKVSRFEIRSRKMYQDSKLRIWIATLDKGLALFDKQKGVVKYYSEAEGIANNQALCILEDGAGYLWISTSNGLSHFIPEKEQFINYDKQDGIQNNQFNYGAALKKSDGQLVFGGISGFTIFNPAHIKLNSYIPPVVFTDLKIFNKSEPISQSKHAILNQSITTLNEIAIPYKLNAITLEFAALYYTNSNKINYKYMLEGFDQDWNSAGTQRTVTYTNLDPGTYTFKVVAYNNHNQWKNTGANLIIHITPPYYKTWWFKLIAIGIILSSVYLIILFITVREKLKNELVFERVKANKLHELDMMKIKFFTNISHEIRTPLTLIISPLEKLLKTELSKEELKKHLELIHRNAQQLHKLITQLLDFRKLESGNLKLELSKGDLAGFVQNIVYAFEDLAAEKNIHLKFKCSRGSIFCWFDSGKIEKIVNNLLSNAMKFTSSGGEVSLTLTVKENQLNESEAERFFEITVKDSGVGIIKEHLEKIFDRFFQSSPDNSITGTGIGLTLTRELVKLHHGEISVSSEVGKGSSFVVTIPLIEEDPHEEKTFFEQISSGDSKKAETDAVSEYPDNSPLLLVIEDNADVRFFIRSHFEPEFRVEEAADGKEGLNMAIRLVPDIIISDIMLPGMDGMEICRKIKKDERTSHIPIVLLTALSSKESQMSGIASGADDYITKPFDISLLKAKVDNLISIRESFKAKYANEFILQPKNITISSPDERFLQKAIDAVEKYISDSELDIDKFSLEVGVSRMQLYRKLEALTGMTVKEFIRSIRLKRAAQLLVQKKLNVSEVAYAVGFKDISHFRKCFHQEFGMSATEYMEKMQS